MKNILKAKILLILTPALGIFILIFIVVIAVCGYETGVQLYYEQASSMKYGTTVLNNQLYADRYRELLNKYLTSKGYVSLERLVFYLQRTHNVLDTSVLSSNEWDTAYLANINEDEKQMIPIKTICISLKNDETLKEFTVESGLNDDGVAIEVIDLCNVSGIDITTSDEYDEDYYPLIYSFPLKTNFVISSIVFENRDVNLDLSEQTQANVNYHSGWDFAVPIGTNFYSICDGTITNIVNAQKNDLSYNESKNSTGNYITVECSNGYTASYHHIQYNSQAYGLKIGSIVKSGDLLGRTSTTGLSTGPHLHLGLKDKDGNLLDALAYIDFTTYEGTN